MNCNDLDRQSEILSDRRERANNRYYDMLVAKEDACDALIGELHGKTGKRFYVNCLTRDGRLTGKTREFIFRADATHFLIRNNYV